VLGSLHEELRLRLAYGEAFERYRKKVSFLLPRPPQG
jgi:protein-S-isoprenylcysteine O-methyltransferase Ste14